MLVTKTSTEYGTGEELNLRHLLGVRNLFDYELLCEFLYGISVVKKSF